MHVDVLTIPLASGIDDKDYHISCDIQSIQKEDWLFLGTNVTSGLSLKKLIY